jgi:hypothetical protein
MNHYQQGLVDSLPPRELVEPIEDDHLTFNILLHASKEMNPTLIQCRLLMLACERSWQGLPALFVSSIASSVMELNLSTTKRCCR